MTVGQNEAVGSALAANALMGEDTTIDSVVASVRAQPRRAVTAPGSLSCCLCGVLCAGIVTERSLRPIRSSRQPYANKNHKVLLIAGEFLKRQKGLKGAENALTAIADYGYFS
jgi:hypothetical protein